MGRGILSSLKEVVWLGDSKDVVSTYPAPIREDLGFQLYQLQQGKAPTRSRPMKSIGASIFELKEQDHQGWYRVIYTIQVKGKIYVLHSFKKQSAKTSKTDLEIAKSRLKQI
jgi:phage-related protein